MRFFIQVLLSSFVFWGVYPTYAQTKISIVEFEDKTAGDTDCHYADAWWLRNLGSAFKEMLSAELMSYPRFKVLERTSIRAIHENEHELVNSDAARTRKKGQFQVADYVLAGAVSEFEHCAGEIGGDIDVGNLLGLGSIDLKARRTRGKAAVDLRVISAETGEILKSVRGESEISNFGLGVDVAAGRLNGSLGGRANTPLGQLARRAIHEATKELVVAIPTRP